MPQLECDFSAHCDDLWAQIREALPGELVEHASWVHDRLIVTSGEWKIALDYHEHAGYRSTATYTRFHAPFVSENKFRFTLRHESLEDRIGKLFGMQDIKVGEHDLDRMFLIQSNYKQRFKTILEREPFQQLIKQEPEILLTLHDDHGYWEQEYERATRDVAIEVYGRVQDPERLHSLYNILAEVLHGMCDTRGQAD